MDSSRRNPESVLRERLDRLVDLHLDLVPYLDLDAGLEPAPLLAEALALRERFVPYAERANDGARGWKALSLYAVDGDERRVLVRPEDAALEDSRFARTEASRECPRLWSLVSRLMNLAHTRNVLLLWLEPGCTVPPHRDGGEHPVIRSTHVALNMPEGCEYWAELAPDGSHTAYTRRVPFAPGSVMMTNVSWHHAVYNRSDTPRVHLVSRGQTRVPLRHLVERARVQNGLRYEAELLARLEEKYARLGRSVAPGSAFAQARAELQRGPRTR